LTAGHCHPTRARLKGAKPSCRGEIARELKRILTGAARKGVVGCSPADLSETAGGIKRTGGDIAVRNIEKETPGLRAGGRAGGAFDKLAADAVALLARLDADGQDLGFVGGDLGNDEADDDAARAGGDQGQR